MRNQDGDGSAVTAAAALVCPAQSVGGCSPGTLTRPLLPRDACGRDVRRWPRRAAVTGARPDSTLGEGTSVMTQQPGGVFTCCYSLTFYFFIYFFSALKSPVGFALPSTTEALRSLCLWVFYPNEGLKKTCRQTLNRNICFPEKMSHSGWLSSVCLSVCMFVYKIFQPGGRQVH